MKIVPNPCFSILLTSRDDHSSPTSRKVHADNTEVLHCSTHISKCLSSSHLFSLRAGILLPPQVGPTIHTCSKTTWTSGIHWIKHGWFLIQVGLNNSPSEFMMRPRNDHFCLSCFCKWRRCQELYSSHAGAGRESDGEGGEGEKKGRIEG